METIKLHPRYRHLVGQKTEPESAGRIANAISQSYNQGQARFYSRHRSFNEGFARFFERIAAVTRCDLEDDERNVMATGFAFCSQLDQFCRAKGRQIALGRAKGALTHKLAEKNGSGIVEVEFVER